ncbi:ATP-dependent helicase [Flexivirga caeni]|uniref:DNA 3'-5' helicase n=1 Tax=Flexivirga caeni TaxID=2294115 RepID=A0A3M9M681_9MICO|nr:ATP-dependent DNA helicase [Flexivirga caeni]RNI21061.1 ATP-dependent helicase [Flexivirga caeni]
MLELRRGPELSVHAPDLDEVQQAVRGATDRATVVLGAPGTGKTTLAVECVVAAVERGLRADDCLLLAPTRLAAAELRDRVTARLRGTSTQPLARTHQALGFGILRQAAALAGDPAPRLLSGPEQDVVLRELLAGHAAGDGIPPQWPEFVRNALPTRGFRGELRDLLMRAVEWGLTAEELAGLGRRHDHPEWVAAAQVLDEYDQVTALSRPGAFDPAWILSAAADLLDADPDARRRVQDDVRFVVVDDAQELTRAAARLLRLVVAPGTRVVLIGDPDAAVQGFRGADPLMFGALGTAFGATDHQVLPVGYRQPAELRAAAMLVSERIGTVAGAEHRAVATRPGGRVEVALLRAAPQEAAHIAAQLRRAHLLDGVPWSQQAVIVRGQARAGSLRRALATAGVPVSSPPTVVPLRDEPAVRPFLALLETIGALLHDAAEPITPEGAADVLTSPLGAADAIGLRRLRRALRSEELGAGGTRSSDELLAAAVTGLPWLELLGPVAAPALRVAHVIRAGKEAAVATGATAETVLWAMWEASGLAAEWQAQALAGGRDGTRADQRLDAIVALFSDAAAYVDRLPGAAPLDFLEHVRSQDVPGDRLVPAAPDDEAVTLLTPQAAAGRQWQFVVVAGVQEGVWPDLRLRGSLLGSERLVDVLADRGDSWRAAQTAVRYDETRQFLVAVTRASARLLVTAVRSEDEQPSPYLDLVDPLDRPDNPDALREFTEVARPTTLSAVVAELRQELAVGAGEQRTRAAAQLARLAAAGVRGADPAQWWALRELTDDRPLRAPDQRVQVSPSRVESFGECGLRWLLTSAGGEGPDVGAAALGTLVHEVAQEFADSDPEAMAAALDERWARLGLGDSWVSEQQRTTAQQMLTRLVGYLDEARAQGWAPVGVEIPFDVLVGRAHLTGRVDRLEQRDGRLRVIDLKTGSSKPTAAELETNPQLGAYQVAIAEGGFEQGTTSGGAALVQVGKAAGKTAATQVQAPLEEQTEPRWAYQLIEETADGMSAATFTAQLNKRCRTCAVRKSCPLQPEGARS